MGDPSWTLVQSREILRFYPERATVSTHTVSISPHGQCDSARLIEHSCERELPDHRPDGSSDVLPLSSLGC